MVVLIVKYDHNNSTEVFGPFPNANRANEYAASISGVRETAVQNLIVPYAVVQQVVWRHRG